jgi:branched-chain amino acid transport system substrate-binding protein
MRCKSRFVPFFVLVVITLTTLVAGCAAPAAAPAAAAPTAAPVAAAATAAPAAAALTEIKIGSIAPLTGAIATYGQSHKNAVDLAVEQINKAGGILGAKVVVIHEDDQGDPVVGANAAKKLIEQDKVAAISGPVPSKIGMAVAPIAEKAGVPMVATGTNPDITKGKPYVYRSCWTDDFQGAVMAKFSYEQLKGKTAAILYDLSNDYAKSASEVFANKFKALGGTVVAMETHPADVTDFRAQLTKIIATNPDIFFAPDFYSDINLIVKQAKELGLKAKIVGADGWDSPDLDLKVVDGAYFCSHFSKEDPRPATKAFVEAFKAKYGSDPDLIAVMGYDSAQMIFDAIKRAGSTDGKAINDALAATKGLAGAQGDITLNDMHDPITLPAAVLQIQGGKVNYVTTFQP